MPRLIFLRRCLTGLFLFCALSSAAVAQHFVFKCKKSDGAYVFQDKPCGAHAAGAVSSEEIGHAAGAFLTATYLMEYLGKSPCHYVLRRAYSTDHVLKEIRSTLSAQDRQEMEDELRDPGFKRDLMNMARQQIDGGLDAARRDGVDQKIACGLIASGLAMTYKKTVSDWQSIKRRLAAH